MDPCTHGSETATSADLSLWLRSSLIVVTSRWYRIRNSQSKTPTGVGVLAAVRDGKPGLEEIDFDSSY